MVAEQMMIEKRILVAVDESEQSMHALSWCLTNLLPPENKNILLLLYVKPSPVYSFIGATNVEAMEGYGKDIATSVMYRAQAVCSKFNSNTKAEKIVGSGDAKEVICAAAKKLDADILLTGSHDYGFLESIRSMENQTVINAGNVMDDPNAQIAGSDGVHQQAINPNAQIVVSDGGQTPVGHVPSGHVPVGYTVIGQFSVPLGQIST
ncbi:hypothetical protein AgCh_038929 [Apium graveolens]